MDVSRFLSLKNVTLFYGGGALLEYQGYIPIKGNDTLYLMPIDVENAENAFSTLSINDLDGGAITEVFYQLPEDILVIQDVKCDEFIKSFLPKLIGKTVSFGLNGGESISGILLGFDENKGGEESSTYINILSSDQIRRISIKSIEYISLGKSYSAGLKNLVKGEVKAYVGWRLDPETMEKDKHLVSVKYFQSLKEGWKPLYHLYISEDIWVMIVWCEVANPTQKDWKDISITLTTKAPFSASSEQKMSGIVEYKINGPITIPKFSRTLIPVAKLEVKGELQVQIEDSSNMVVKVNVVNDDEKIWLPGKLAIWKDEYLLGVGRMPFVKKGGVASIEVSF